MFDNAYRTNHGKYCKGLGCYSDPFFLPTILHSVIHLLAVCVEVGGVKKGYLKKDMDMYW